MGDSGSNGVTVDGVQPGLRIHDQNINRLVAQLHLQTGGEREAFSACIGKWVG